MRPINALSVLAFVTPINSIELVAQDYYSPIITDQKRDFVFDDLTIYSKPISVCSENQKIIKYIDRLKRIENLQPNWDGQNACGIDSKVIKNTLDLLKTIPDYLLIDLNADDITPSPYGTIVIESEKDDNEISIEIGENDISFYSEIESVYFEKDNIDILNNQIQPDEIIQNLQRVFI